MKKNGHDRLRRSVMKDLPDFASIRKNVLKEGSKEMKNNQNRAEGPWGEGSRTPRFVVGFIATAVVALVLVILLPRLDLGGGNAGSETSSTTVPDTTNTQSTAGTSGAHEPPESSGSETTGGSDEEVPVLGASIQVMEGHLETGGSSFKLTNNGNVDFTYGIHFGLMQYVDGAWVQLEPHTDMIVAAIAYSLEPGESAYIYANWEPYYGALESGRYRYINDGLIAEFKLTTNSRPGPGLIVPPDDYNEELLRISEAGEIKLTLDPVTDLSDLKLTVENTTDTPYLYGSAYVLFLEIPGQENHAAPLRERWAYVNMLPNTAYNDIGYELAGKARIEEEINLMYNYRLERAGTYHLVKSYFPDDNITDRISVTASFTVSEALIEQQPAVSLPTEYNGKDEVEETEALSETTNN